MPKLALGVEYDGTEFAGWQSQQHARSVQHELEQAVSRVANEPVAISGAGRTDSGVHAFGQVAHFVTSAARTERQWLLGINSNLPGDIAVKWVVEVPESFDARRSALWRRYRYTIVAQPTRPALARRRAWWLRGPIDCAAMTAGASYWLGEKDFSAFRAAHCQSTTPMRRLLAVSVSRQGSEVRLEFTANAFLYHMVRNMVGTLVEIGAGRRPGRWARELLEMRDRKLGGITAPPEGLTLMTVAYAARWKIPLSRP